MFKRPERNPSLASPRLFGTSADTVIDMTNESDSQEEEEEAGTKVQQPSTPLSPNCHYHHGCIKSQGQTAAVGPKRVASEVEGARLVEVRKKSKMTSSQQPSHVVDGDASLALALQAEEEERHRTETRARKKEEAERSMASTKHGRAWLFVERVLDLHRRLSSSSDDDTADPRMTTVAVDDMVFLAERLIDFQSSLQQKGTHPNVTIGYHYTQEKNMKTIKRDGLMTKSEQTESGVRAAKWHLPYYGDGIYIATNPFAFQNNFGNVGLMAAVLLGNAQRAVRPPGDVDVDRSLVNTFIGNKHLDSMQALRTAVLSNKDVESVSPYHDEIVLLQSSQCMPIMRFCSTLVSKTTGGARGHRGNEIVWRYHEELQGILDELFNDGARTEPQIVLPPGQVRTPWRRKSTTAAHAGGFVRGNGAATSAVAPDATTPVPTSAAGPIPLPMAVPSSSTALTSSTSSASSSVPTITTTWSSTPDAKARKEKFLMFTRILMKYLQQKDPAMHQRARQVMEECAEKNKAKDPAYASLTVRMQKHLRSTVGEANWKRAEEYLDRFLTQKQRARCTNNAATVAAATVAAATVTNGSVSPPPPLPARAVVANSPNYSKSSVAAAARVLNGGGWRSDGDMADRRKMIAAIVQHLQQRRPNAPPEWTKHIPPMAKRLEESLYLSAPSLRAYNDVSTLQHRLVVRVKLANTPSGAAAAEQHNIDAVLQYHAPSTLNSSALASNLQELPNCASKSECPICLEPLRCPRKVVRMKKCKHEFHENCIDSALKAGFKCPVCRRPVGEPQGCSPSGQMRVSTITAVCSGFEPCRQSIEITYVMHPGTQMPYHENPGQVHSGTTRKAYLPDNADGRRLLRRLRCAFLSGLTFTIGTSLTTRCPNSIVWSSVHHKTSLSGGLQSHGFPDPGYFINCNEELDALGVPSSEECD